MHRPPIVCLSDPQSRVNTVSKWRKQESLFLYLLIAAGIYFYW